MIKLRNTRLAAVTAIAALGIGAVAVPAAALAASHPSKAKVVTTHKPSTKAPRHDSSSDGASSIDSPLDR
jgi:hypothetical protein